MDQIKRIVNFFFELNEQKRRPRSGWHRLGVTYPESIAEHTTVCAQIAFVLAALEGANAEHAAALALFHDTAEVRQGDNDWVSRLYRISNHNAPDAALAQIENLPITNVLSQNLKELHEMHTLEALIAKDADLLELALQARVYQQSGYPSAFLFIEGMRADLKTNSARQLLAIIEKSNLQDWWLAIPEIAALVNPLLNRQLSSNNN